MEKHIKLFPHLNNMNSLKEIKTGFIRIYEDVVRAKGLPTLTGRIVAVLLLEGGELNHKEISSLTGYSMASVNRTLNQLVNLGIVHKHKEPMQKTYVFHVNANYPEIFANTIEQGLKIYETQRNEIDNLIEKLAALEMETKDHAEINRLRAVIESFGKVLEATMDVLERLTRELRQLKGTPNSSSEE